MPTVFYIDPNNISADNLKELIVACRHGRGGDPMMASREQYIVEIDHPGFASDLRNALGRRRVSYTEKVLPEGEHVLRVRRSQGSSQGEISVELAARALSLIFQKP